MKKTEFSFKGFCIHPKQQQKTLMKERYEYTIEKTIFITQVVCLYNVSAAETDKYYRKLKMGFVFYLQHNYKRTSN